MRILHPPLDQPVRLAATMRRIAWEDHTAHRGAVELESTGNSKKEHSMFNRFRFPARIRLIDGGGDEGGSGDSGDGGEPKSFTQEQVDQIVEKGWRRSAASTRTTTSSNQKP